jgi:hypothetical protein
MTNVRKERSGWWMVLVVALGYVPIHIAVALFVGTWVSSLYQTQYGANVMVRRSGEVNFQRYAPGLANNGMVNLDGTPRPVPEAVESGAFSLNDAVVTQASIPGTSDNDSGARSTVERLHTSDRGNWFARLDEGHRDRTYLEGYDWVTRRRIGFLSARGFTQARPEAADQWVMPNAEKSKLSEVFEGLVYFHDTADSITLPGGVYATERQIPTRLTFLAAFDGVWEVDFASQKTRRIADIPGIRAICRLAAIPAESGGTTVLSVESLLVATSDRLIVLDPVGGTRREYPLPENRSTKSVQIFSVNDGGLVLYQLLVKDGRFDATHVRLWWLDKTGKVTRTIDTPPQPPPDGLFEQPPVQGATMSLAFPTPLPAIIGWGLQLYGVSQTNPADREPYEDPSTQILLGWFTAMTALIGAVCAALAVRRACQLGGAVPWQWGLFAFVLGLPGLIGLLYAKRRPELVQCEWLRGEPLVVPPKLSTDLFAA